MQSPWQSSDIDAHTSPTFEIWMSMKSHMPPQRPRHGPWWIGTAGSFAVAETNTGASAKTSVVTATVKSHAPASFLTVLEGKASATWPGRCARTTGKFAFSTPGGATIIGVLHVAP